MCIEGMGRKDRSRDLGFVAFAEIGVWTVVAIGIGPAVKSAAFDLIQLAGWVVIAQKVSAVIGRKKLIRAGLPIEAHGVSESRGVDFAAAAVGLETHDRGSPGVFLFTGIAARTDVQVEPAVGSESKRPRPMISARRNPLNDSDGGAGNRDLVGARFGERDPRDRPGFPDVERAVSKVEAVGLIETLDKNGLPVRSPIAVCVPEDLEQLTLARLTHDQASLRAESHHPSIRDVLGKELDVIAGRDTQSPLDDFLVGGVDAKAEHGAQYRATNDHSFGQQELAGRDPAHQKKSNPDSDFAHHLIPYDKAARLYPTEAVPLACRSECRSPLKARKSELFSHRDLDESPCLTDT